MTSTPCASPREYDLCDRCGAARGEYLWEETDDLVCAHCNDEMIIERW